MSIIRRLSSHGLLITGPVGVGKTRLARELLSDLGRDGRRVLVAMATESARQIPFGALAHLLPVGLPAMPESVNLLRAVADALLAGQPDGEWVLFVDDVHLLDDGSATLLLHLAVRGGPRMVLTARAGTSLPDAVEALLRGAYVSRVDVAPLDPDGIGLLLERTLGGQVQTAAAHRLWEYSGGNLLWLQHLVDAGLACGALTMIEDVWQWQGPFQLSPHLLDLVGHRIGRLPAAAQRAAELLALGEPLAVTVFETLVGAATMDELDRRDLVRTDLDHGRTQVRLAHPLYGEVLRRQLPPHRQRRHFRDLAAAVERTGTRRREDVARVGSWRLEAGETDDPRVLLSAADYAVQIVDFTLAARLAQAVRDAGVGAPAHQALAVALGNTGDGVQDERLNTDLPPTITSDRQELEAVQLRATNLYLSLDRPAEAVELLHATEQTMTDLTARAELAAMQAVLHANQADWSAYRQAIARARPRASASPQTTLRIGYAECIEQTFHGRTQTALRSIESVLPILANHDDIAMARAGAFGWLCVAQTFSGRLREAEATARAQYEQAKAGQRVANQGIWRFYLSRVVARQGRLRSARRYLREAVSTLHDDNTWAQGSLLLGEWAILEALAGNATTAQTLIHRARSAQVESYGGFHVVAYDMARPWILAVQGEIQKAVHEAIRAAERARQQQTLLWEAELLHLPIRLGQPATVHPRLAELTSVTEAPHIVNYAEHARALTARDGSALEQVCTAFDTAGMHLHAAEAAAHAARIWSRAGNTTRAQQAADRCHQLAQHCEGTATPAVLSCWTPELTDRERGIARLAATGLSSQHIAQQLGITVRTVDNHLHRVYRKTGVNSRRQLQQVLAIDHPESADPAG